MSNQFTPPSTLVAGLRARCPRCGIGKLFAGYLTLAKSCEHCGLDFAFADPADGPAFFGMMIVGILVVGVWGWTTVAWRPPIWIQFAVFLPALTLGTLGILRPLKAWLVAEQYVHHAGEARWSSLGDHGVGGFTRDRRKASENQDFSEPPTD